MCIWRSTRAARLLPASRTGAADPSRVVEALNDAGLDLAALDGKRADAVEAILREASSRPLIRGSANPRVRMLINDLIEDCLLHPLATVKVER